MMIMMMMMMMMMMIIIIISLFGQLLLRANVPEAQPEGRGKESHYTMCEPLTGLYRDIFVDF
jgi:hypothetical protein